MDLDQKDNAYWCPSINDTLRAYEHPETGQEFFSVTSIQSAVHETPQALKNWERNDPEWASYWRHFTSVRGTYIHEQILGEYADRDMPGFELETEAPMDELSPEDQTEIYEHTDRARNMWAKIWGPLSNDFGDVRGVEVRILNEELGYAGTFDLLMYFNGELSLIDLKTSKSYYPKYGEQLSAYWLAAEKMYEIDIEQPIVIRLCPDRRHNPFMKPAIHYPEDKRDQWRQTCEEFHEEVKPTLVRIEDDEHLKHLIEEAEE